eukprot:3541525-Prymnesium_polylepis.1
MRSQASPAPAPRTASVRRRPPPPCRQRHTNRSVALRKPPPSCRISCHCSAVLPSARVNRARARA